MNFADFSGADLSQALGFTEFYKDGLRGARFNDKTKLPGGMSPEQAKNLGMMYSP